MGKGLRFCFQNPKGYGSNPEAGKVLPDKDLEIAPNRGYFQGLDFWNAARQTVRHATAKEEKTSQAWFCPGAVS